MNCKYSFVDCAGWSALMIPEIRATQSKSNSYNLYLLSRLIPPAKKIGKELISLACYCIEETKAQLLLVDDGNIEQKET